VKHSRPKYAFFVLLLCGLHTTLPASESAPTQQKRSSSPLSPATAQTTQLQRLHTPPTTQPQKQLAPPAASTNITQPPYVKVKKPTLFYKKLIQTIVVVAVGYLLILSLVALVNRRIHDLLIKHVVRKNVIYLLSILVILYVSFIWIRDVNSLTIFLSVIGAGVTLALQEAILCIAGWFLILIRRPFAVGERIELGGVKGDVIDIRLFQTSLLEIGNWVDADQSTGRIANIPNSAVFKKENYNYSRGFEFIWNEIKILVTFESDFKLAEQIMLRHAKQQAEGMEKLVKNKIREMTRRYMIHYDKLTPIVYTSIENSGILLTLRYLTEARNRRSTQDQLCRAILDDFHKEANVNFAYPTYRIVKQQETLKL